MAVYTDITDDELAAFLADYDLGEAVAFKGIAEGVENSNFLLETETAGSSSPSTSGAPSPRTCPISSDLLTWLADRGYPSAKPIADRSGATLKTIRGKPAALVEFLPGLSARRPTVAHCREAGEGLAWLHLAGEGYPARRANDLGQPHWAPLFAKHRKAADGLKPGLAATIDKDLAALALSWPRGLPSGVIHADYFPDNVFFKPDGKFAAAIDFYFACDDAYAYDVAVTLNAWCFEADGSFNITAARALIAGYERRRPLSPAERDAIPILARGAAMRFFLTRLADWGATPAGALVKPKDPLEYERKLAVHREGLSLFGAGA
jgi:homoserine kinase type II